MPNINALLLDMSQVKASLQTDGQTDRGTDRLMSFNVHRFREKRGTKIEALYFAVHQLLFSSSKFFELRWQNFDARYNILQIALPLQLSLEYDLLQIAWQFNGICNVFQIA